MATDYKDTLKLPKTSFPMRANLAKREPEYLKFWKDIDVYHEMLKQQEGKESFILHDGPPYANGNIHIGTAFNKILKDFIPKYKVMKGYYAPYVPGWDTHGLPIELHVLKTHGITKDAIDPVELREKCTKYAHEFLDIQRNDFIRLGVIGDWENPYITLNPEYEAAQLSTFADLVEKGLVYKGHKPVYWCIDCQTALAAAEIEYWDEVSPSVFIAYSMPEIGNKIDVLKNRDVNVIVWTTTPWTLPASMAVALGPGYDYVFVESGDKVYLLAEALLDSVAKETGLQFGEILYRCKGRELEKEKAIHPFYSDRVTPLLLADYILLDTGTGCVHTAPGHGVEDYETGVRYGIEIYNPVDGSGHFLEETPIVGGLSLDEGAKKVLSILTDNGRLLGEGKIMHSYPHCWRCKKPVIFRSTEQWFIAVSQFRKEALDIIDKGVQWIPDWGKDRIYNMVRDRSDWCISRQRVWGVPIPAFYCEDCGELILKPELIRAVQEKVKKEGSTIWWKLTPEELLGDLAVCPACGSHHLVKDSNIMDVWFDSGVSHFSVLETRPELRWPADLYLEGSDQHRGWFQTSLLTSVATRHQAPYKSVLTHGFIVDGEGKKMSKSIGNVIRPQEVIDKYGADILRLWVASTDYRNDIRISDGIIKSLTESYRRIRNTARYLLGNLSDFNPHKDSVAYDELMEIDKWILSKLNEVIERATQGFEDYEFHVPTFVIHQFCVTELSSFFLDVSKDRLYADETDSISRRGCQTVMWQILDTLTRLLAPILSFTAEEIWQEMKNMDPDLPKSVFLSSWPEVNSSEINAQLDEKWDRVLTMRGAISRALESARTTGVIGHSLEARVEAQISKEYEHSQFTHEEWSMFAIVSDFKWVEKPSDLAIMWQDEETGLTIAVDKAKGEKCPRCWKYSEEVDERGLCPRCARVLKD